MTPIWRIAIPAASVLMYFCMIFAAAAAPPNSTAQAAIDALRSEGPYAPYRNQLMLFGRFIGTWDMDLKLFDAKGKMIYHQPTHWMFSWILDGRAIQDVIVGPGLDKYGARHIGTSVRYYNPKTAQWSVVYVSAANNGIITLKGGKEGDNIMLRGTDEDRDLLRWQFSDITNDSFRWQGYTSTDSGKHWWLEQDMTAARSRPAQN